MYSPVKDSDCSNTQRNFQLNPSSKTVESSTNIIIRDRQKDRDATGFLRLESTLPSPHELPCQPQFANSIDEWRLHQSKLHAWRREQVEIALFRRIHIPELTQDVSFWQVAIVCSLLKSWKRRFFPTSGQRKSLDNSCWGLTPKRGPSF